MPAILAVDGLHRDDDTRYNAFVPVVGDMKPEEQHLLFHANAARYCRL